ncbi:MAG: uroporphyrinogen-III synthase [Cellulomonas sp.]|nr:uroporphyrinogen-III synthase [Cellulomonas sp.]
MTGPLEGLRVLVPRPASGSADAEAALRVAGAEPVVVPLVRTEAVDDPTVLDAALADLRAGRYAWLAVTSAAAVGALVGRALESAEALGDVVGRTKVAAVGPATARALATVGVTADLVGTSGARALADAWPTPDVAGARVLFPRGDLAGPELADGRRAGGWAVDDVVAYRTVPAGPAPDDVVDAWRDGSISAALLTSPSTVRALAARLGPPPSGTLLACIGPTTADAARDADLPVAVVAPERTMTALVGALADAVAAAHGDAPPAPAAPDAADLDPKETR